MIINHNTTALNTHRQLGINNNAASENLEKLSSGLKINRAGDDAAGLAISEKMRSQIRGLDMAAKNSQDGISLIQTAEGALNETHSVLQRMRELAVQAANDTNTTSDREQIQKEINSLTSEINRIGNTTEFNTQKLLNGAKDSATQGVNASPEIPGIAGIYEILDLGVDITVDGQAFDAGDFSTTFELADLMKANEVLAAKYEITSNATDIILTQRTGQESATAPITTAMIGVDRAGVAAVAAKEEVGAGAGLQFQIGANENQSMTLEIGDLRAAALGLVGTGTGFTADQKVTAGKGTTATENALDVSSHENASAAITKLQAAIDQVSGERSKLGAVQNRLEHTINNLGTSSENLTAAESRIRDVNIAAEMMNFTKNNILTQAAQAMLAQSNQMPEGVLQLLR